MGSWTFAWICCPQLPYHLCKNGMHSTCFYSTGGHTPIKGGVALQVAFWKVSRYRCVATTLSPVVLQWATWRVRHASSFMGFPSRVATASASYRIEKPRTPKNWKNRPQKIQICQFFSNLPSFCQCFSYFREVGVFLFCSWPTRSKS